MTDPQHINAYRIAEADYQRHRDSAQVVRYRRRPNDVMTRYERDPLSKYLAACFVLRIDPVTQEPAPLGPQETTR